MKTLLLLIFLLSNLAHAEVKLFKKTGVSIQVPEAWTDKEDLLGFDILLYGPIKEGHKPTVGVIYNKGVEVSMDHTALKKNQNEYKVGRTNFTHSRGGEIIKFLPYKFFKNKVGHHIHQQGYEYKHKNGLHYVENSFYIICNKELYNIKSSIINSERKYTKEINEMVRSFNCNQ